MIAKTIIRTLFLITVLTIGAPCWCQTSQSGVANPVNQKTLKLVAEYKKNHLEDMSSDGRLLLFYQTSIPMRIYTIPGDGRPGKTGQPVVYDDVLRVVDRESGRELKSIKVAFYPDDVKFIPGTQNVFYKEPKSRAEWRFKVWNFLTGEANVCSDDNAKSAGGLAFLDSEHALYTDYNETNEENRYGSLTLPTCSRTVIGPVNPSKTIKYPFEKLLGGGFLLSPKRDKLIYRIRGSAFIVLDVATLNIKKQISPPTGLNLGDGPIFTPDGKFLLVVASNTIYDKPDTRRYLLFYNTTKYEIVRQLDVTKLKPPDLRDDVASSSDYLGTAIAISPDSTMMAVGYTKEERKGFSVTEQAQVFVYEIATGEEVARATHPELKENRDDPFIAKVGKLLFTPDGKFLISSTYDTRVWEILPK